MGGEPTIWERFVGWLGLLPVRLAYRLIWLAALTGNPTARSVYSAMWRMYLDLPRIKGLSDPQPGDLFKKDTRHD